MKGNKKTISTNMLKTLLLEVFSYDKKIKNYLKITYFFKQPIKECI